MTEREISKNTGVSKATLQDIRKRIPDSDYETKRGSGIVYKDSGLHILSKILGIPKDSFMNSDPQSWAKVTRITKNKSMVLVQTVDEGNVGSKELRLKVKDNGKFVLGMVVPIRSINGDVCYLARKQPRTRGKW